MKEHSLIRQEMRVSLSTALTGWSAERRRIYMLRNGTVPASADHKVWPAGDAVAVAITVLGPDTTALQNWLGEAELPPFQAQGWFPLGYDVCDSVLTSGLLNCGYAARELESFVNNWGTRLNRWHLFDRFEDAFEFAAVTDARVAEHAPFGVFGVYVSASVDVDATWHDAIRATANTLP